MKIGTYVRVKQSHSNRCHPVVGYISQRRSAGTAHVTFRRSSGAISGTFFITELVPLTDPVEIAAVKLVYDI